MSSMDSSSREIIVMLHQWESEMWKFAFLKQVDKGQIDWTISFINIYLLTSLFYLFAISPSLVITITT